MQCDNVLIENCTAIGASDAGIYVGQSNRIIVRNSIAHQNVAGIEIENSLNADVFDNVATGNTGGILVFGNAKPIILKRSIILAAHYTYSSMVPLFRPPHFFATM